MRKSFMKHLAVAAVAVGSIAMASHAAAVDLAVGSDPYVGLINDGIPSSLSNEVTYINTLLDQGLGTGPTLVGTETYTRSLYNCGSVCPDVTLLGSFKDESPDSLTFTQDGTIQYVLGKYDASKAGAYVWWVGGLATGTQFSIPDAAGSCGKDGCGLSHVSLFTTSDRPPQEIPEPGSLALLGLALAGLGLARRGRKQ
jgi:hypothetical protein